MLRSAVSRSIQIPAISRALAAGQQGAQQGPESSWRGEDTSQQHSFNASHIANRAHECCQPLVIHGAQAGAASLLLRAACIHTATRVFSPAAGKCQQARRFKGTDAEPTDASKAPPAEQHAQGSQEHANTAEEERRATAEQACTSADSGSADTGNSSSRSAWTGSEEYQRMAAELKRVAGLNTVESSEKADVESPLSGVVQAYRYLKVGPRAVLTAACSTTPPAC